MKTVDLFNLYMGDSRPGPSWSESSIGCLKVRLSDDYNDKVSQLPQPPMWTLNETGLQRSPSHKKVPGKPQQLCPGKGLEKKVFFSTR